MKRLKIGIVEDNLLLTESIVVALSQIGYEPVEAVCLLELFQDSNHLHDYILTKKECNCNNSYLSTNSGESQPTRNQLLWVQASNVTNQRFLSFCLDKGILIETL